MIEFTELERMYHDWYVNPQYNGNDNAAFHEHMPTLRLLCNKKRVVELGSRFGTSTLAILSAHPESLYTVDIERKPTIDEIEKVVPEGTTFIFAEDNDLTCYVPDCDVLFIDTLHTYEQLSQELRLHGNKAREYIIMHDLVSFGRKNEDGNSNGPQGLIPAMEEFITENSDTWEVAAYYFNCNGLVIFRRKK